MTTGKVTVLIPTYNHGKVLVYQLESLLKQTQLPKQIIVLDDGSTDDTRRLLRGYQDNPLITVIHQRDNCGLHAAIDRLLNHVDTKYFAFAAADDLLLNNWCETTEYLLEKYTTAKMVISNTFIYQNERMFKTNLIDLVNRQSEGLCEPPQYIKLLLRSGRIPPTNTILYRSDIIDELIRPIFLRTDLSSLVDVLLTMAIATKYPISYSTKPTGIFVRGSTNYGHAIFENESLSRLISSVDHFATQEGYIRNDQVRSFILSFLRHTWAKQIFAMNLAKYSTNRVNVTDMLKLMQSSLELALESVVQKRYKFIGFSRLKTATYPQDLENLLDDSLLKRLEAN